MAGAEYAWYAEITSETPRNIGAGQVMLACEGVLPVGVESERFV